MSQWIRVSPESPMESESSGPIETRIQASPYDVPVAFRASLRGNRILIEFRYLDKDEPTVALQKDTQVTLILGQHSKRLMGIDIEAPTGVASEELARALRSDAVRSALQRLRVESADPNAKENYVVAENIVETKESAIIQELLSA